MSPTTTAPARRMTGTLKNFEKYTAPYIYNGTIDTDYYQANLKIIHTLEVQDAWLSHTPNKVHVLGTLPPDNCPSDIPRPVRSTLAQLCSRYCQQLNSYSEGGTVGTSGNYSRRPTIAESFTAPHRKSLSKSHLSLTS